MLLNQHANRTPNGETPRPQLTPFADFRRYTVPGLPVGTGGLHISETRPGKGVDLSRPDASDGRFDACEERGGGGEIHRYRGRGRATVVSVNAYFGTPLTAATTGRITARR